MIYDSFNEAYIGLMGNVLEEGHPVAPRPGSSLGPTLEILAADFGIPADRPRCTIDRRKMSQAFSKLEPFFLFTHQYETDIAMALMTYAPNLKQLQYNDKTGKFDGNYGDRIHIQGPIHTTSSSYDGHIKMAKSQLVRAYHTLKNDPESRRAVVTIHNPVWDLVDGSSKDIPCTLNLHFMIRGQKLHCFCTMRSNDLWYGTPHNVMMFTFLQRALAGWLGVDLGLYFHRANSLHLYEKHADSARELLALGKKLPEEPITYPYHRTPEETRDRAQVIIDWEKQTRMNESPAPFTAEDPFEQEVVDAVSAFWNAKQLPVK